MSRWLLSFEAIDPTNFDQRWKTGVPERLYKRLQNSGHEKAIARLLMVTESELMQFLKENPPAEKFVPYCHLSKEADTLTVYFEGDADYSKRLNDHVTLYLSLETNEIVGCRINGIAGILEDLPNYIRVNHDGVELAIIFLAFRGGAEHEVSEALKNLASVASQRKMVLQTSL